MRSVFLSLLLATTLFLAFTALPASLGLVSLVRMLLFIGVAACLVAAVQRAVASLPGRRRRQRTTWVTPAQH